MKIQGYELGTEVKWTDEQTGGFKTGIVRARYYDPNTTEIDGEQIKINVIGNSPSYKVEDKTEDRVIVLEHTDISMQHQNEHT